MNRLVPCLQHAVLAALAVAFSATPAQAQSKPSVQVELAGIQVVHQGIESKEQFGGSYPFNAMKTGCRLALILKSSGKQIIDVDIANSKLEAFIDSTRQSLLNDKPDPNNFGQQDGFDSFPNIGEDGKVALVTVVGSKLPKKEATKLGAKGELVVQVASKTESKKSPATKLEKGRKLSVGDIKLSISEAGKPQFFAGEFEFEVALASSNKAFDNVAAVKFLDSDGKEIESGSTGGGSMGFGDNFTYTKNFGLKKAPKGDVTVELELWTDLKEEKIPFAITAGFGR